MANATYPLGVQAVMGKEEDLDTDVLKVIALKTGATFNAAHSDLTDISASRYVGTTDQTIASPTITGGVLDDDGSNITYSALAVDGANNIVALVVYNSTTGTLLAWIDTDGASKLPFTPNGEDVNFNFNASGILKLGT